MSQKSGVHNPIWFTPERELIGTDFMSVNLGVEKAIVCCTSDFYPRIVKLPDFKNSKNAPHFNGAHGGRLGRNLVVYRSYPGAPAAAMLMETLVASGIKRILMLGLAGSLSADCKIGDLVVPTWGIREEGTSYHYLPANVKVRASTYLVNAVSRSIGTGRIKKGGVWSTDAPYRETRSKIREYSRQGVVAVDMESTALMAVAMHRKVAFAPILVISDEAFGEEWVPGFSGRNVARSCEFVCESVLGLMSQL